MPWIEDHRPRTCWCVEQVFLTLEDVCPWKNRYIYDANERGNVPPSSSQRSQYNRLKINAYFEIEYVECCVYCGGCGEGFSGYRVSSSRFDWSAIPWGKSFVWRGVWRQNSSLWILALPFPGGEGGGWNKEIFMFRGYDSSSEISILFFYYSSRKKLSFLVRKVISFQRKLLLLIHNKIHPLKFSLCNF